MLSKKTLCLFLSGLVGFCLGFYFKIQWEESKFIIAEWDDDPVVVVCPDSSITSYRVHSAVEWWGIRGYNVSYVHWDDDNLICNKGLFTHGIIFIRGEGELLPDTYAVTTRIAIANKMVSASIHLPNKNKYMRRLLEHELGHAFGMRHAEKIGHIMHPIHEYGGETFYIPD